MRVALKTADLQTSFGKELLELVVAIAMDGKLDLEEIKRLRAWLRANQATTEIVAIGYLAEIMNRVAADGVIDREELIELHLAVERVVPASHRQPIVEARKRRDAARREQMKEARRRAREKEMEERDRLRQEEYHRSMRLRSSFAKVRGVKFPNDDGTERQFLIRRCRVGERLVLVDEPDNAFSELAVKVVRQNGEQLGYVPDYLAERMAQDRDRGYRFLGVVREITGGTFDKPTRGVNFLLVITAADVRPDEVDAYVSEVFAADGCVVEHVLGDGTQAVQSTKPWWRFW
jgi:hypothetical protein